MKKSLLAAAIWAALASCAAEKPPVVAIPANAKSVAVFAAIAPQVRLETTGTIVFEDALDVAELPEWHLNDVAVDAAVRALSPRYRVAYTSADDQFVDPDSRLNVASEKTTSIQEYARSHAKPNDPVDLIVVLCLSARAFPFTDRPYILEYIGVTKWRSPISTIEPVAHSYVLATVLDGKTFKIVAETPLLLPQKRPSEYPAIGVGGNYPEEQLKGFQWQDRWKDLSEDQRNRIRDKIIDLLSASTFFTLQSTLDVSGP